MGQRSGCRQLLSQLGYLPFDVKGAHVALTPEAQESAAVKPPKVSFDWKYPNIPDALRSMWAPGSLGTVTKGAIMMFQNDHGLTPDGNAGPVLWRSLINAVIAGKHSSFGYTWVNVSLSGQSLSLWHNGHTVLSTPVNTGIPGRATDPGTFPVYSHLQSTTMSGTNPDGTTVQRPRRALGQLLQRRRRPALLPARVVRVTAEPRVRRDAAQPGRRGVAVHAGRGDRSRRIAPVRG